MKIIISIAFAAIVLAAAPASAHAKSHGHHSRHHHHHRHYLHGSMLSQGWGWGHGGDAAYQLAVRQGGPCGLTTERIVFGSSDHVLNGWNPWLAREWLRFPTTSPAPGMVAVWRNHSHVEAIESLNGDGTFNHRRSLASVIVVDPRGAARTRYAAVAYRHRWRHKHYAMR